MSLNQTPCIEVDTNNVSQVWPHLISFLNNSQFIACDFELSGLGPLKALKISNIEDRYKAISEVAQSHSIVSVGISCFEYLPQDSSHPSEWVFKVNTFNILTLCLDEYVLDSIAEQFLIRHGFDFEKQKKFGLNYLKGTQSQEEEESCSVRSLFNHIFSKRLPIILHNGFLDLIFLYQNFFGNLPARLDTFLADLSRMFPRGVYDTKYIFENEFSQSISYLEYVFYSRQRANLKKQFYSKSYISIIFAENEELKPYLELRDLQTITFSEKPKILKICKDYGIQGWCKDGEMCDKSHNIDYILDQEALEKSKVKKKLIRFYKNSNPIKSYENGSNKSQIDDEAEKEEEGIECQNHLKGKAISGIHRSGFDAFMTGFCFVSFLSCKSQTKPDQSFLNFKKLGLKRSLNRVYLIGKNVPLTVRRSIYVKPTVFSENKLSILRASKKCKSNTD